MAFQEGNENEEPVVVDNDTSRQEGRNKLTTITKLEMTPPKLNCARFLPEPKNTGDCCEKDGTNATNNSLKDTSLLDTYSCIALEKLKEVSFNWFSFVALLQPEFASAGFSVDVFDQFLIDVFAQIGHFGLSDEDIKLVDQSRSTYLCSQMAQESESFYGSESSSDSSDDEIELENKKTISKKLNRIKDSARKRAKEEIEFNRFMRKKVTPSTKTIIKTYPNIGKVIENFVEECDIGADKWRRTGVYTFSGDIKNTKRVTFGRIQEKLKEHFGREFSYGTFVQLCCARHKRRLSRKRYKGVANVRFQKARKGFNLMFNPDYKWSRSMYKLLSQLQSNGTNMMLLNRDDQAGFRLDSTYTHKSNENLSTTPTLTTRTRHNFRLVHITFHKQKLLLRFVWVLSRQLEYRKKVHPNMQLIS